MAVINLLDVNDENLEKYVLWKWQKSKEASIAFLVIRIILSLYIIATFFLTIVDLVDYLPNTRQDELDRNTFEYFAAHFNLLKNAYYAIAALLCYVCYLIQEIWATLALIFFKFKREKLDKILSQHRLYIVTQTLSYNFTATLIINNWNYKSNYIELFDEDNITAAFAWVDDNHKSHTCANIICFYIPALITIIDIFMVRQKVRFSHIWLTGAASIFIIGFIILGIAVKLIVDLAKKELEGPPDEFLYLRDKNYKPIVVADEDVGLNRGAPIYFVGVVSSCLLGHFFFHLVQILRDFIKRTDDNDDNADTAPQA